MEYQSGPVNPPRQGFFKRDVASPGASFPEGSEVCDPRLTPMFELTRFDRRGGRRRRSVGRVVQIAEMGDRILRRVFQPSLERWEGDQLLAVLEENGQWISRSGGHSRTGQRPAVQGTHGLSRKHPHQSTGLADPVRCVSLPRLLLARASESEITDLRNGRDQWTTCDPAIGAGT